jgi:hypothetical protein
MATLCFHDRFAGTAGTPNRYDGWTPNFPDDDFPFRIVFTVPGDRSGMTADGKMQLDASEIELCFVLTSIDRDQEHWPKVAHYHLSTPEEPIEPYHELVD